MQIISEIVDYMMDELHDAKKRIKSAYEHKADYPDLAKHEYEIALQELAHADKGHADAVAIITAWRAKNGEPPVYMIDFWNDKHSKYIDKYAKVKTMVDAFNK